MNSARNTLGLAIALMGWVGVMSGCSGVTERGLDYDGPANFRGWYILRGVFAIEDSTKADISKPVRSAVFLRRDATSSRPPSPGLSVTQMDVDFACTSGRYRYNRNIFYDFEGREIGRQEIVDGWRPRDGFFDAMISPLCSEQSRDHLYFATVKDFIDAT